MLNLIPFILMWLGYSEPNQATFKCLEDSNYRCAKYMIPINNTPILHLMPELPEIMVSFKYYIQYGEDLVIEITDPGTSVDYFPIRKAEWHYKEGYAYVETIYRHVEKYYAVKDSLRFNIIESRGSVQYLCNIDTFIENCDTLIIESNALKSSFLLYLTDSIPNILFNRFILSRCSISAL